MTTTARFHGYVGGSQGRQPRTKTIVAGVECASKTEGRFYSVLLQMQRAGIVTLIEPHPVYIFQTKFTNSRGVKRRQRKYTPDFRATYADGTVRVWEVKGAKCLLTPEFKLRRDAVEILYGIAIWTVYPDKGRWIDADTKEGVEWK